MIMHGVQLKSRPAPGQEDISLVNDACCAHASPCGAGADPNVRARPRDGLFRGYTKLSIAYAEHPETLRSLKKERTHTRAQTELERVFDKYQAALEPPA